MRYHRAAHRPGLAGVALAVGLALAGRLAGAETPPPQRAVLDNGLVLLFKPNPTALTLAVGCFFKATARVETRDTAGLRFVAQQALLDLADASGQPLEQRVGQAAMQVNAQVSPDYLETLLVGTGDQLPAALGFVRELLSARHVDARRLIGRKAQARRDLESRGELAETLALDLATAHLYRDTPAAWPVVGGPATTALRPEQIEAFWRLRCVPNNTVVTVSGPVTWAECQEAVQHALGDLLPRQVPPEPAPAPPPAKRPLVLYQPWSGDNAAVVMAASCPGLDSATFPAAAVLTAVLGSGEGSRLFRSLRDERGLIYSVSADIVPSELAGMAAVVATCAPDQADETFTLMQSEATGLGKCPPTPAELERAKRYLIGGYLLGVQRNSEAAHYLGLTEILAPHHGAAALPELLAPVTVEDVVRAANWLSDRTVWVQVGGHRPR